MTSVKLWNYYRITFRFFPFPILRPFWILLSHSPRWKCVIRPRKKKLEFFSSFGKQLSHSPARGYLLLVLVNDVVRRWLSGTFTHCANELKKLLDQRKSTCPGLLDGTFFKACVVCLTYLLFSESRNILASVNIWCQALFRRLKWLHFSPTGGLHF